MRRWAAADVDANDLDQAIAIVRDIVDVLRVFQQTRARLKTTAFGLPGDVRFAHLRYLQIDEQSGVGFRNTGDILGTGFPEREREHWARTRFPELAAFAGRTELPRGPARALLAVRLLSRAVLEPSPAMRLLGTVIAVETILGSGRKYQLARRAVFFTCGQPWNNLCGRDRPSCRYIKQSANDARVLKALEQQARTNPELQCSEWLDFIDRYDDRSGIAHGDPTYDVPDSDADQDLYWAIHRLLPGVLPWLLDHHDDPIGDLDGAIAGLPPPS